MDKAERGDLVRVVRPDVASTDYKVGDIFEVKGRNFDTGDNGVHLTVGWPGNPEIPMFLFDSEYVIHRKAGEEDAENKEPTFDGLFDDRLPSLSGEEVDKIIRKDDAVHHPNHYTQGRFETIEIIEEVTQGYSDGYVAYCVGNALKYLARAPFKHESPSEDIAKARAYLDFAINRLGGAE